MKLKSFLFVGVAFIGLSSEARITDNQIIFKNESGFLKIEPKKGFHLNAEAPANATFDALEALYKPIQKTEKLFTFKIVEKAKKAKISFYVCDDKKTACEQHQQEVTLANLTLTAAPIASPGKAGTPLVDPAKTGMIVTDSTRTSADVMKEQLLVSKNGKPTLLVFSAPWCPACIRMHTETYPTKEVSEQLKKVNFVKLNSDLPENYELSESFHVKAIPTLILLNLDGQEVYRWLDYQAAASFAKGLNQEVTKTSISKESLEMKASLGDADAISLVGQLYYNALDCAQAVKWLSLSKKTEDQKLKLAADISCAQDDSEKDDKAMQYYVGTLEKAIVMSPSKIDQMRWTVDWIEKKKELKQLSNDVKAKAETLLSQLAEEPKNKKQLAKDFQQSTYGEAVGFETAEVHMMRSRLFTVLDQISEKEKSDKQIIEAVSAKKYSVNRPGEMLIAIAYLREAGEKKKVEEFYKSLLSKNQNIYVYHEKYARYMLKEKSLEKALEHADLALKYAEGNQPQLYLLKARILKEMDQKEKMVEVVNTATQLKEIQHVRFKKTLAQLNKLKDDVTAK